MERENANALRRETPDAMKEGKIEFPEEVHQILGRLGDAGFEAFVVGGCLRDAMIGRTPKDWDIATNASPEEIQKLFPDSFYENQFGTVGVKTGSEDPATAVIEVTTFRRDVGYSDKRHPDRIEFARSIQEDLARRDFTINAMAHDGTRLADPFSGAKDLDAKLIRAVGEPDARFSEDALRLMRAVRFAAELDFAIEQTTQDAMREHAGLLQMIAKERIADELKKIVMSERAEKGVELLRELSLLKHVLPELEEGVGVGQNRHHVYTVWEHNVLALKYAAEQKYSFHARLASLLHDVGKPRTKQGEGPDSTFYGHEAVGGKMAAQTLSRLRFSKDDIEKVSLLVRNHMFQSDPEKVTPAGVRRLIARVGQENITELLQVREADRIGSGVPKARPYRLRYFMFLVEKVQSEPTSRKQMAVDGHDVMEALDLKQSPRIGAIIDALFEEVLDDPSRNTKEYLTQRMQEYNKLTDEELGELRRKAQEKYKAVLEEEEQEMKARYYVK